MDIELNALRRVAKAAKRYQDKVIQKRAMQVTSDKEIIAAPKEGFEIGSAEFELSEALNAWFRLQETTS
ncbi:MAG: hypothetical protein IT331_12535 [Anaerolineae bacterium]|nr:hypothetical protein [Anaerolineae bacterium]